MSDVDTRSGEIASRVEAVRARVAAACERTGRSTDEVRLIAITKGFPVSVVRDAIEAGITDFGENRVQELDAKASEIPGETNGGAIRWHLVGSLQRNKARRAVELADTFHALDSQRLARELEKRATAAERVLPCYVQVNVSGEDSKFGLEPGAVHAFLEWMRQFEHLRVIGLMTLAAPADEPSDLERVVRPQLRMLADLARSRNTSQGAGEPSLRLSMGMSGDFEIAIEEGATDIRLGTVLFGARRSSP